MEFIKNNKAVIILIIGFLGLVVYNWDKIVVTDSTTSIVQDSVYSDDSIEETTEDEFLENTSELETEELYTYPDDLIKIKVEVKGEVLYPDIYELYYNSRVNDLISAAGGYTEYANTDEVNGARILVDGETLIVSKAEVENLEEDPVIEEVRDIYVEITGYVLNPGIYLIPENYSLQDLIYEAGGVTPDCDLTKINWDITLCLGATVYIPGYDDEIEIEPESDLININTADLEELMDLPGIGEILGQRIIDYRTENGYFLAIEDIMFVSGIKDTIYEEIKESITV